MADDELLPRHSRTTIRFWLPFLRLVAKGIFGVLGPIRVRGAERLPPCGPVLILANHLADVDPIVAQYASARPLHFMAKSELFSMPVLGWLLRWYHAFPVKRGEPDRGALKMAAHLLKDGRAVCVFPEGQLSENGELQEIKPGVALIVRMSGAPVICLGITDTQRILPYGKFIPRPAFRRIGARWGEVRQFDKGVSAEEILAWIEGQLRDLTSTRT